MPQPATFGRRRPPSAPPPPAQPARPKREPGAELELSPSAEAFRNSLASKGAQSPSDFAAWRRAQTPRRALAWLAGFALLSPGVLCFALKAPWHISTGLEIGGMAASWWLRRERRRHLNAIAGWNETET